MSVKSKITCMLKQRIHALLCSLAPLEGRARKLLSNRRGSETISTLIIAATIMLVTLISANVAEHLIELQVAQAEFEQAKEVMIILADMVEEVGSKMYSSSYVKFNCRSGMLDFLKNCTHIKVVLVTDSENLTLIDTYTSSLRFRSGVKFSVVEEYVRGDAPSILGGEAAQLISIYKCMDQDGSPSIWLHSRSIRLIDEGVMYLESRGYNVNIYELIFVRIGIGLTFGSGSLNVKAYGKGVSLNTYLIENSGTVHLYLNGQWVDSASIVAPALLYVVTVEVEIATV